MALQSCMTKRPSDGGQQPGRMIRAKRECYFEMDEAKQKVLLEKLERVNLGDSRRTVINQLGIPTYDQENITKAGRHIGRTLKYYLKIREKGLVSEKYDRRVRLEFDTDDRLTRIVRPVDGVQ